jgi:poly(3-hydroxybutyrate) depolymerase
MLALRGYLAGRTPPPLLLIHGDADHIVHFDNATHAAALWLSLSGHDALAPRAPRTVQRGNRRGQRVFDWVVDGEPYIRLVRVQGLAHAWSGGAASQAFSDPTGPDALRMAFAFFDRVGGR